MRSVRIAQDRDHAFRVALLDVTAPAGLDSVQATVREIGAVAHRTERTARAHAELVDRAFSLVESTDRVAPSWRPAGDRPDPRAEADDRPAPDPSPMPLSIAPPAIALGLVPSPRTRTLYVTAQSTLHGWAELDGAGDLIDVDAPALCGHVNLVSRVEVEKGDATVPRLAVEVMAGAQQFVVDAPWGSPYARDVLAALARLTETHLAEGALTIETRLETEGDRPVPRASVFWSETAAELAPSAEALAADQDALFEAVRQRVDAAVRARFNAAGA